MLGESNVRLNLLHKGNANRMEQLSQSVLVLRLQQICAWEKKDIMVTEKRCGLL